MGVLILSTLRSGGGWPGATSMLLTAILVAPPGIVAANGGADVAPDVAVKAAFLYNFARFAEWPALPAGAPIVICIVGDDEIAAVFVETVRGQNINGHKLDVRRPHHTSTWWACHVLFIADGEARRSADGLGEIKTLPVLTVSDRNGFSQADGIIELYIEGGRMRFAINVDAADRSGLRLSSRLLGLAKVIRERS